MVAAAYSGTISIKNLATGEVQHEAFTVSDVAAAYAIFTRTANNFTKAPGNANQQTLITDVALTAAGTDTNKLQLLVSQRDTGVILFTAGFVNTINNRVPQPIPIAGGSTIQLKQLAV